MRTTEFILCADKSAARLIRRTLAMRSGWLGVEVGAWPALLELAGRTYCIPPPANDWTTRLEREAAGLRDAFWAASLASNPEDTLAVLATALKDVILALGPGRSITATPPGVSPRGARQLADLARLWNAMEHVLPADLALIERLRAAPAARAVRPIRVRIAAAMNVPDDWRQTLIDKLNADAGGGPVQAPAALLAPPAPTAATREPPTALGALQRNLYDTSRRAVTRDSSLQWLAVRDPLEEVELIAGMAQAALAEDADLDCQDIAVMIPNDEFYARALADVFAWAGLPLSGLEWRTMRRDLGRELVQQFLYCRRPDATPAMALAGVLSSPLMPWPAALGSRLAQAAMDGGVEALEKFILKDDTHDALGLLIGADQSPADLRESLAGLGNRLCGDPGLAAHHATARATATLLAGMLGDGEIDWRALIAASRPRPAIRVERGPLGREGIAVFLEHAEPWRTVRRLFVAGFTAGRYPRESAHAAILGDADRAVMNECSGARFKLATPALQERRQRFVRQLRCAAEAVVFTVPRRNLAGESLAPSATLSHMARLFTGAAGADGLVLELDRPGHRDRAVGLPTVVRADSPPRVLPVADLALGRNLLGAGVAGCAEPRPESPSNLETLLVSPLAWLLQRIGALPRAWHTDSLDALTRGGLAHYVFEQVFTAGAPLPAEDRIEALAARYLRDAIVRYAPYLAQAAWRIERRHLRREVTAAAISWHALLRRANARVVRAETALNGCHQGCRLRGRADAVLQLPGGNLLVVDYKKSKGANRVKRMQRGYDLQASLYRLMLDPAAAPEMEPEQPVGVAYFNMNDRMTLTDTPFTPGSQPQGVRVMEGDVAGQALALLARRFGELRAGAIRLNRDDDAKRIETETGIKPYALETSPLIALFSHRADIP